MPSRGRKFISEFLLPSLNEERFGSRLMWLDIKNKVFQMQWNHKAASDWTISDAAVFAAWDKRKGHYKPEVKEYYTKSKQRFRAALNKFIKLKYITELPCEEKYTKIYCIGDGQNIIGTYTPSVKSVKESEGSGNTSQSDGQNIIRTNIPTIKSEGNGNTSQKVKRSPEDMVLNLESFMNAGLLPEENSIIVYQGSEMENEFLLREEQVVTDYISEYIPDSPDSENSQNYIQSLNSSSEPAANICNKDDLKGEETIKNDNDFFHTTMGLPRQLIGDEFFDSWNSFQSISLMSSLIEGNR